MLGSDEDAVRVVGDIRTAARRCTYFDHFVVDHGVGLVTDQSAVEAEHLNGRPTTGLRQATRYGLHGVHEYKGKFNPQIVRALCNVADPTAELLIDPFCGSGTGPLEGLRLGLDVLAIDRSPMAWYLTKVKLEAAEIPGKRELAERLQSLSDGVATELACGQSTGKAVDLAPALGVDAADYLRHWFPLPALAGLSSALASLHARPDSAVRNLALIGLSSILRKVSLQLPEDLRVRRRREPFEAPALEPLFREASTAICRGLTEMADWNEPPASATVVRGSADDAAAYSAAAGDRRRLIVTSPPYATALPYIDTDRLSILALGLASARDLTPLERELLGSREWVRAQQDHWDERREKNLDRLPDTITSLLTQIHQKNTRGNAGFRRKALPSLLYRYFVGMAEAMSVWTRILECGERAVLIVGHNHTTAAGQRIDIPTPELLGDAAVSRGFRVVELIPLETWPRYGLHSANGVPGEDALVIERIA